MVKASYEHTQRIVKRAGTLLQSSSRKRALLIGISYDGVSKLESSHSAVDKWKGVLEGYGYCGEDVIVMKDTESELGSKYYPTHDNITRVLEKEFILLNEENVVYFFLYSGHSDQTDCTDGTEEDGKNEVIITADGEHILDDFLKKTLVDALPSRCRLNAILDTCHSGTLMGKCNLLLQILKLKLNVDK
ncbi:hypothetical protein VNI00_003260 [Paramarasmius palmivorus]|uniref:Peptidase C14 caspase domain-containing protein n=1 Tax=Paramarasmius palmivorus TaxID=297713 RepID=A0AAW0DVN5_9AGAR